MRTGRVEEHRVFAQDSASTQWTDLEVWRCGKIVANSVLRVG